MKKTAYIFIFLGLSTPAWVLGQSDADALRYSQTSLTGTARFVSMGGAFGALGADFSALSYNPAGIGLYRKSEFTFTPSLYTEQTTSYFQGQSGINDKSNFNFGDIGFVFAKPLSRDNATEGWKSLNFAIGYNRLNNFHTRSFYEGVNKNNSYLDYLVQGANNNGAGTPPSSLDPFYQNLAYQTYLINNPDTDRPNLYTGVIPAGGELQRRISETRGSVGEMVLSLGSNYSNRVYIGGTMGIDFLHYEENTSYQEIDKNNSIFDFNNFNLQQNIYTSGVGINFKFGMIYRATDWMRIGAAIHTPTWYSMHDDYNNTMYSNFDNGDSYAFGSPFGSYDYSLTTPFKAIGSLAFVIGKQGLISADYEYLDYSNMHFSDYYSSFTDVNNQIRYTYSSAGNIKVGGEWRFADIFAIRGGYGYYGSPFTSGYAVTGADQSMSTYSGGLGLREASYFIDFAYAYSVSHNYLQLYSLADQSVPGAINKVQTNNFMLTFGFRF